MITCRDSKGVSMINNTLIPEMIKAHIAFTNYTKSIYGFNDPEGNFGVFSYDHHVATFYADGHAEFAKGYIFKPHRELLEAIL